MFEGAGHHQSDDGRAYFSRLAMFRVERALLIEMKINLCANEGTRGGNLGARLELDPPFMASAMLTQVLSLTEGGDVEVPDLPFVGLARVQQRGGHVSSEEIFAKGRKTEIKLAHGIEVVRAKFGESHDVADK